MPKRAGAAKGRSGKRRSSDGFVAEPPLALIVGAIALGMLVGALLSPGDKDASEAPALSGILGH